jgi:hypothetical protein
MFYVTGHPVYVQVLGNDCLPARADAPACPADLNIAAYRKAASECACDWQSSFVQSNAQTEQHSAQPPDHADDRASWQAAVKLSVPALSKVAWWQEPGKADELVRQIQVGTALPIAIKALSIMAASHC